jgi:hypothetical protein
MDQKEPNAASSCESQSVSPGDPVFHRVGRKGARKYDGTVSRWKPSRPVLVALVVLHIIVTAITLRDLSQRSDAQIRGPRWFWRLFAPLQMGNSAIYWVAGRRNDS